MPHMEHAASSKSVLSSALDWWHELKERHARLAELEGLGSGEVDRMAADVGLSKDELLRVASEPAYMAELLYRRLDQLGLSEAEIRKLSPLLMTDLQRSCACCADKKRCSDDFAAESDPKGWESYCPNAGTLRTLK